MHGAGIILEVVADARSFCSIRRADESPTDRRRTVNRDLRTAQGLGPLAASRHYLRVPGSLMRHTNARRLEPAAVHRGFAHALIQILCGRHPHDGLVGVAQGGEHAGEALRGKLRAFALGDVSGNRHDDPAAIDSHRLTIQFYESLAAILEAAGRLSADAVRSRR